MSQGRGQLTERIKIKSKELMGSEIDVKGLRLMVYIQYVMTNEQKLNLNLINKEEREIFSTWRKKGYVEGGSSSMTITKEFWDIINEIIYLGYVDLFE